MSLEESIFPKMVSELKTCLASGNTILLAKSGHQSPFREQKPWTTLLNLSVRFRWTSLCAMVNLLLPHHTPQLNRATQDRTNQYRQSGRLF